MSTFMQKPKEVVRKWYVINAENKVLGRVAAEAATILRGKHKPTFTPHVDCGDNVVIINSDKIVLTGKKLEQKYYYYHTGWIGGIKSVQYKKMMANNSDRAVQIAVKGMLPKTTLGRKAITRLHVYKTDKHNHQAQKPENYSI